jgi:error-prone DNA polymerase
MGFYSPGTLIEDARRHGVEVRPVDVTVSRWETTLEPSVIPSAARNRVAAQRDPAVIRPDSSPAARNDGGVPAVRLGVRTIRGLGAAAREKIEGAWAAGPFTSITDLVQRTRLDRGSLRALADAGALDAFMAHEPPERRRRAALWEVLRAEQGGLGPLFNAAPPATDALPAVVPAMSPYEITEADYRMTALSLHGHPMAHLRARLRKLGVRTATELRHVRGGAVVVAGLVICRQRPGTAKGFVFLTLEDETGMVNVVIRPDRFEKQALLIARSPLLLVRGRLQVEGTVINVRAEEFEPLLAPVGAEYAERHDFH